ncbi:unnamed protein product [Clonostachys chloroleuca]|uniref:NAD(+) diphosphatase n=1 Tax=Clonostachys chloroleuca TaxID=1926264 RepID=A0AA35PVV9_9HYPO|nr:unnamed protein product [Clonostachys chloroleuca]
MTSSLPQLPEVALLQNDDSMLSRRFGKEITNYYAGGSINRISFLRADTSFLQQASKSPRARYFALNNLGPVVEDQSTLAVFSLESLKSLIGSDPFKLSEDESIKNFDSTKKTPLIVFLGLHEGPNSDEFTTTSHGTVKGEPYFAVDVTPRGTYSEAASVFLKSQEEKGFTVQKNARAMTLHAEAAAMYAQARSMVDWNTRNGFCAGCGNPNLSVHAGYKRVCPPTDLKGAQEAVTFDDCPTRHGVSNVCFPRTDPTMIAAIVSADGQRVLLGRQTRYPPHLYSTLAGFLEPGESFEECVRREVWEEAGVKVGRVVVHSTQPWPYPSSLMIGAIGQAVAGGETIELNDKELEVAKWFPIEEVRQALLSGAGALDAPPPPGYKEGELRVPPPQAIANRLLTAVAEGYLTTAPKI